MNKTISKWFSALVLLFVASVANAQTLTIADFDINQGETKTVNIVLTADATVYGIQTDIAMPEGLTLVGDPVALPGIMTEGDATLVTNLVGNKLRVALYSAAFKPFKDAKAGLPVIALTVKAADDLVNLPQITLTGSKLTSKDANGKDVDTPLPNDEVVADAQVYSYAIPATLTFGPAVAANVRAYAADKQANEVNGLQVVKTGDYLWTAADGNARAAAAFNMGILGGPTLETVSAPFFNAYGVAAGTALGLYAVWTSTVQYTQDVALKAGTYYVTVPVFNAGGDKAIAKNLIGVVAGGKEVFAETTQYAVDAWTVEKLTFTLEEDAIVTLSLGYTAGDFGKDDMPRLFVQFVNIATEATPDPVAAFEANKAYTITSQFGGAFVVKNDKLTTTTKAGVAANAADANQQFAFVTNPADAKVYLYSVGAKKFVNAAGLAAFDTAGGTTETVSLGATANVFFPSTVALNGTTLGIDNTQDPAVVAGATEVAIAWTADFDPADAKASMIPAENLAGYYTLYNVGKGQFFTKGNGWGTQASITTAKGVDETLVVELIQVGNNYAIRTSVNDNNNVKNKGVEALAGGTIYTDQSQNKQSTWEFKPINTAEGIVYNIVSADNHGDGAGKYMSANDENTIVGPAADGNSANAQWKLIPLGVVDADAMAAATAAAPADATGLIVNANFSFPVLKKDAWTMVANNYNGCGGEASNHNAESWCSAFTLSQALTVPNGVYSLTAQAAITDYTNAYDGVDYPVVYANDVTSPFISMEPDDRGTSMGKLSGSFSAGKYIVGPIYVKVTDGNLTVGVRGTRTNTWCIWDNFQLTYYGDTEILNAQLGSIVAEVAELRAEAETLKANALMPDANIYELGYALDATEVIDPTLDAYKAAKATLTAAIDPAKAALAAAEAVQEDANNLLAYIAEAEALIADDAKYADEAGAAAAATAKFDELKAAKYTTAEAVAAGWTEAKAAFAAFVGGIKAKEDIDVTDFFIVNAYPYASNALPNGWEGTKFGTGSNGVSEYWGPNTGGSSFYQTINLPAGTYKLTAVALTRTGMVGTLFANDFTTEIATVESSVVNNRAQAEAWFNDGNGVNDLVFTLEEATAVKIGLKSDETTGDHWTVWRDFTLVLKGDDTVGVNAVATEVTNDAKAIFDLTGRRVAKATKGIFIINGRKVVK